MISLPLIILFFKKIIPQLAENSIERSMPSVVVGGEQIEIAYLFQGREIGNGNLKGSPFEGHGRYEATKSLRIFDICFRLDYEY